MGTFGEWLASLFQPISVTCEDHGSTAAVTLGTILVVGTWISYAPQIYKVVKYKTGDGLSRGYLMMGSISWTTVFWNTLLLQRMQFECCPIQGLGVCMKGLLGFLMILSQYTCFHTVVILYFYYFPKENKYIPSDIANKQRTVAWRQTYRMGWTIVVLNVCLLIVSLSLLYGAGPVQASEVTKYWAYSIGFTSMIFAVIQFLPQIRTTWRQKSAGAMSIPTMLIQVPGSFLIVYALASQPGVNVTTWIRFVLTGLLQGILLVLCIYFHLRNRGNQPQSRDETPLRVETQPAAKGKHPKDSDKKEDAKINIATSPVKSPRKMEVSQRREKSAL